MKYFTPVTRQLCAALATLASLCSVVSASDFRVVARTNGDAPGRPNERLVQLRAPSIDNQGQVAFSASTLNRETLQGTALVGFVERTNWLQRIETKALNAGPEVEIYAHTSSGLVLFRDAVPIEENRADEVTGVWIDTPTGPSTVVRGDLQSGVLRLSSPPTVSDNGLVAYSLWESSDYPHSSIWLHDGLSLKRIAIAEDFSEPGSIYPTSAITAPIINNTGAVLFEVHDHYDGLSGLVLQRDTTTSVIASEGMPAVGVDGAAVDRLDGQRLNNRGDVAYWSILSGDDIHSLNNQSLYFVDPNGTHLVAREDAPAAGVADGARFDTFWRIGPPGFLSGEPTFELNDQSQLAFMAWLRGDGVDESNNQGIWQYSDGELDLILREGMPAPGGPSGSVVAELSAPTLNDRGQMAFSGKISGPGVDALSNEVIWATDTSGVTELIVREGDLFLGGGSPFPVENHLQRISFPGGETHSDRIGLGHLGANGRASGMNDLGQIAFFAQLYNGEQMIVVSNAVAVPEPATATAALVGLLATLIPGRRLRSA